MKLVSSSEVGYYNGLWYGRSGSGKTHCAATSPGPVFVDVDRGRLTLLSMGVDVPIVEDVVEDDIIRIIEDPEYVIKDIQRTQKFKDYDVKTWVFDSATSLQAELMGKPTIRDKQKNILQAGRGIMGVDRNRGTEREPSIEDYRALNHKMLGFFNGVRNMKYNTIITAHAALDDIEEDSDRTLSERGRSPTKKMGLPVLTGKLKYHADNLCDMFLFFEAKNKGNGKMEYSCFTLPHGPWHARNRFKGMEYKIVDPTFDKIVNVNKEEV